MNTTANILVFIIAVLFAVGFVILMQRGSEYSHMNDWRELYREEFYKQEALRRELIEKEQEAEQEGKL